MIFLPFFLYRSIMCCCNDKLNCFFFILCLSKQKRLVENLHHKRPCLDFTRQQWQQAPVWVARIGWWDSLVAVGDKVALFSKNMAKPKKKRRLKLWILWNGPDKNDDLVATSSENLIKVICDTIIPWKIKPVLTWLSGCSWVNLEVASGCCHDH